MTKHSKSFTSFNPLLSLRVSIEEEIDRDIAFNPLLSLSEKPPEENPQTEEGFQSSSEFKKSSVENIARIKNDFQSSSEFKYLNY